MVMISTKIQFGPSYSNLYFIFSVRLVLIMKRSFFIFEQTGLYSPTELNEMGPKVEMTLHAFAFSRFL